MTSLKKTEELTPEQYAANANTPMFQQYFAAKKKHPEALLFFRLGDFYELFFEDALLVAKILQITLTHRGKHLDQPIPMCGVPFHAYEHYVKKLIDQGYKIALCEQTETPEDRLKNGGKGPLSRDVVRLMTPATVVESSFLEGGAEKHFLLAIVAHKGRITLAYLDLSSHIFNVETIEESELLSALGRIQAKEILIQDDFYQACFEKLSSYRRLIQPLPKSKFNEESANTRINRIYHLKTTQGLGTLNKEDIQAIGAVLDYVEIAYRDTLKNLPFPKKLQNNQALVLDHQTRINLEIERTLQGKREGSLFFAINHTQTNGGARLLHTYLSHPTQNMDVLQKRLGRIEYFCNHPEIRKSVIAAQQNNLDLTRSLSRLLVGRGGPMDMGVVRDALNESLQIESLLTEDSPLRFNNTPKDLLDLLERALLDQLPLHHRDGGFIREGYHEKLDELRQFAKAGERHLEELQERYQKELDLPTLKVKVNNLAGYFIEIPASKKDKVPASFFHKQSLANNIRYTTDELNDLATKLQNAESNMVKWETTLFAELLEKISFYQETLFSMAKFLAQIDVFSTSANFAIQKGYTRPQLTHESILDIREGRHPAIDHENFVPNDLLFSDSTRFYLLTGPNMAGKSTYLRQTALITLMAHAGLYVPANFAIIGLTDRIFSRIGAGDNLASGMSTFMVEMVETATILNQATERSLIILDELGRGTSTYDGLSLAWAVTESLETLGARTLFATHYFELTELSKTLKSLENMRLITKEWEGKIHFLHKVEPGAANRSYGLHVATLAGIPKKIITRAEEILLELEKQPSHMKDERLQLSLPLARPSTSEQEKRADDISKAILAIDVDHLTPLQALTQISEWKKRLKHDH